MRLKRCVASLLAATLLSGCASIVNKSVFPVTINSHPDQASITVTDERGKQMYAGTTPTTIALSAGESYFHAKKYTVVFSKPGYTDQTVEIKAELSGWYIGNILFGGLIGLLIVDPLTGKMWKLPTDSSVTLAEKVAMNSGERALQIVLLEQVPASEREKLIQLN